MRKLSLVLVLACLLGAGYPCAQENVQKNNILGSDQIAQIGVVVRNIEKSSRAYAELLGLDVPTWELTDPVEKSHTEFHGKPTPARAKLAFFQLGNVVIELIEPVAGPSTWQDYLDIKGEGVHHVAFEVKDMEKRIADLKTIGISLIQRGGYPGGRYSYLDGGPKLGVILELLENFPENK